MKQLLFTILLGCVSILQAQLQSGPMLGYADFQEVAIWLQTDGPAEVQIKYFPKNNTSEKHYTTSVTTQKIDGYTATLIADEVKPSTIYEYKIAVKGDWLDMPYPLNFKTQEHWQYRKDPPAFSFLAGSCVYINDSLTERPGVYESYTNYGFDKERQDIIDFIYAENIEGVIFIDGDRHHTELSKLSLEGKPTIWDITVSPLTSGAHMSDEINGLRVSETYVGEQNYAQITVSGPRKNRLVTVKIKDKTGKII